ncbi:MAG: hypothetical protein JSW46_10100, partial [Gemmatimonadota bacterium]
SEKEGCMIAPRIALLVPTFVLTASVDLFAQQELLIEPGDTVKVAVAAVAHEGIVLALKPDTILLDVRDATEPLALLLASVTRLDVKRGRKSRADLGAGIGGLIGMVAGALTGKAFCGSSEDEECRGASFGGGLIGFVALGAVGAAVGSSIKTDRWEEVPLDQLRVTIAPRPSGGLSVGVRLKLWQ